MWIEFVQKPLYHTPPHSATLHHIPPHSTSLHRTPPHSTTFHLTPPHSTSRRHTLPHSTSLHHTPPHSTTLHHTPPHSTTLHQFSIVPQEGCIDTEKGERSMLLRDVLRKDLHTRTRRTSFIWEDDCADGVGSGGGYLAKRIRP